MPRGDDSDNEVHAEPSRNGGGYEEGDVRDDNLDVGRNDEHCHEDAQGANEVRDGHDESNEEIQEAEQPQPKASKPSLQFEYHPVITGMTLFIP